MNNKLANFRESSRHQSQNDLPPIDKFHPDWWYYRQEVEEPVEIDDNYKNESRHMNKKLIRLTEQDLHRIVKESVNRVIKEEHYNDAAALPYITKTFDELINKIGNAAVAINGESWDAAISNDPFSKALKLIYQAKRVLLNA